jgi:3-keto steroid reductase
MFNSPHHTIQPYKAAIAAVHLSLISLSFIPAFALPSSSKPTANSFTAKPQPVRFGSETDRWGTERVGITPVEQWEEHAREGDQLLEKCDELYEAFVESEGTPQEV